MLFSVEQAFVGTDEKRAPLKTPAWEAKVERGLHPTIIRTIIFDAIKPCVSLRAPSSASFY